MPNVPASIKIIFSLIPQVAMNMLANVFAYLETSGAGMNFANAT